MKNGPRPATATDVAVRAGVSRATVSHILNGREGRFPEETRTRVRTAAEELDYRPSPAGRSLVTGRSDMIVVVMPETTVGQNLQNALEYLSDDAAGLGSNVVLRFAGPDPGKTATALVRLRPLAVVDFGSLDRPARSRLAAQGIPVVPDLDGSRPRRPHDEIGELQVAELTKRDDRQIVYASISDRRTDPYGPGRYAGIAAACARRGLAVPLSVPVPTHLVSATAVLRELPRQVPLGVAAYNDEVALAVLAAAARMEWAVPDDLAVVGVDATDVGQLWVPPLTTIEVDMHAFVGTVVDELAAALGREAPPGGAKDKRMLRLVSGGTT
ncbi:LacI family DNA-binding transcriptional regulator [Streptomyces sp. NPDC006175]|uniref:LacI family DNA-binding transcriptional regulator n=1 Tax=unclassified Streptomyces TaxID=2593676 RepID=UPI0033BB4674